jgi:predicted permease
MATVVTLALGIGANTAIFAVIYGVLLKPLPYREPERLISVMQTAPGVNIKDLNACLADYITYREAAKTFEDVALWSGRAVTVTEFADPERVEGLQVTFRLLPMLGVNPALGRGFVEKDNEEGSPGVVMISHGYWQRRFSGDPKVIGRRMKVEGGASEIIGVLPKGFWFLDQGHDIVLPVQYKRAEVRLAGYNSQAIARLKPGVTLAQANADVARMIGVEMASFPPARGMSLKMMHDARLGPNVRTLRDDLLGDTGKSLWVVMATIGMVLLIACANVANLLLVRLEGRAQELAVRAALGAGRGAIAREVLAESLTLSLLGGLVGAGLAYGVLKLVLELNPARLPRMEMVAIDGTALLFTLAISLLAGLAFGAIPVFRQGGMRVAEALRAGGRNASASRERNLARNGLTVVQVALTVVLLIGSGLMVRTFLEMREVNPGFSGAEGLQTLTVAVPRTAAEKEVELWRAQHNLVDKLSSIPGVTAVSLMGGLPMTGDVSQDPIAASDRTYREDQIPPLRRFLTAAPGTFRTMGVPLRAGREYTWTDIHEDRKVVIISENFAKEYWGSAAAAVGKQIRSDPLGPWYEVVGVVGDVRLDGVEQKAPASVYWSMAKRWGRAMTFLVRSTRAGTESFGNEIRQSVWSVGASFPVTEMRTMKAVYDRSMARTAFTLTLLGISGGMALLLAVVGIYGVISYAVTQRTREIGIRLALGAQLGELKLMFVRNGVLWGGVGALVGLAGAAALSRWMSALLFEVRPVDPLTYAVVSAGLLGAAALASYVPARRVTRVDPVVALRSE